MAKSALWKQNHADPDYSYQSWRNEDGSITYSVPLEAPEDETAETPVEAEEDRTYTNLRFMGGKPMRVHFIETTDREAAFEQKKWLNAMHKQERNYSRRFVLLGSYAAPEDCDCVWDYFSQMHQEEDGFTMADYSDLPGLVAEYIRKKLPGNDLYCQVYLLNVEGYAPKEISEELGIDLGMVYYYRKKALQVAQEYRRLYFDEGQYEFPLAEQKRRTKADGGDFHE